MSTHRNGRRGFAAIASMQGLRPPRRWDTGEEEDRPQKEETRRQLAQLLRDAAEGEPLMDLLVVDEAHHMRNPTTLLYRLGELLNGVSVHRIFLSATPIHLRNRDLHSLLRLIDPDTFEYESTLEDLIHINEPIVAARDLLMRSDTSRVEIIEHIDTALGSDLLSNSKSLRLLRNDLEHRSLDAMTRAEFASRIELINQMANFMTRTRRRDVEELRIVREPITPLLTMHEEECRFYDEVTNTVKEYALDCDTNERFLLSTPQRLLTSSPAAASMYWTNYREHDSDQVEGTDDDLIQDGDNDRPLVARLARLARTLDMTDRLEQLDTKFQLLLAQFHQLCQSDPDAKIIIFSSFKPTLH